METILNMVHGIITSNEILIYLSKMQVQPLCTLGIENAGNRIRSPNIPTKK